MNTSIENRYINLYNEFCIALKMQKFSVDKVNESTVTITEKDKELAVTVHDEYYEIWSYNKGLLSTVSHQINADNDGRCFYFVDTMDECIGEVQRLIKYSAPITTAIHTSDLSKTVTAEAFEKSYTKFIEQADLNAISKKAQGSKIPYGFSEKPECDGAHFKPQYGQGAASLAPYMNWWVVSIYYIPENGNIIMGIEEDRYPHLKEMKIKPINYAQIGNKKINIAVFYSATKSSVNYKELYEKFISVCEEVMRLGLN